MAYQLKIPEIHQCQMGFEFLDPSSDHLDEENAFKFKEKAPWKRGNQLTVKQL